MFNILHSFHRPRSRPYIQTPACISPFELFCVNTPELYCYAYLSGRGKFSRLPTVSMSFELMLCQVFHPYHVYLTSRAHFLSGTPSCCSLTSKLPFSIGARADVAQFLRGPRSGQTCRPMASPRGNLAFH